MIGIESFPVFVAAAVVLLLVPGPAVLYVAARSVEQGTRAGLVAVGGLCTGGLVHVVAAACGLSALLASSAAAFSVVRFAGAAYLVWLGVRALRGGGETAAAGNGGARPLRSIFSESVLVQVLNPKTALFFFAFLPQFVDAGRGSALVQVLVLGCTFLAIALVTDSAYAAFAGQVASRLRSAVARRTLQRCSGAVYLALGLATALGARRP